MLPLYPIRFHPILRHYPWGGRRLGSMLGKLIGDQPTVAESWEVCDRAADQSMVAAGPLAGTTLAQLVAQSGREVFGRHAPQTRFPLLFKFLDAHRALSVQVHPNDEQAARLVPPDLGKTEAWVVLAADPGAVVYAGLKRGFDRRAIEREVARGTIELCLHRIEPRVGDCLFIPAGTVHALGAGLVIAEIQQSSDVTFRLFDWNRVGPDGRPRPLHVRQALDAIDYTRGPIQPQAPQPTEREYVERLVTCDKFILDRWQFDEPQTIGGDERFHVVAVIEGSMDVADDPTGTPLTAGGTTLLPAAISGTALTPSGRVTLLDVYLP